MFDVIECFQSASPTKQTRLIVFQTPDISLAQSQADRLWHGSSTGVPDTANSRVPRTGTSTFVVVDRSTAQELYRVPSAAVSTTV